MWRLQRNKKNPKKVIFSAYDKILAGESRFFKIKTVEDMKFGKDKKLSSWYDAYKKQEKSEKE